MSAETKERDLQEIGAAAYSSILDMVNALECDWERLAELREERAGLDGADFDLWAEDNLEELHELETMAGEASDREDAEQRIQEDPLSIEVRSGWVSPSHASLSTGDRMQAEEFCILLSTGGPAVRIMGELDENCEPYRAWLEVQDWFTPWTQYFGTTSRSDPGMLENQASQDVLLTYARQFYFGS
jgi:hypothetical protein